MDAAPKPPVPELDAGRIERARAALAGVGHLVFEPDRQFAASAAGRWPWLPGLVREADDFHRRAARWAVLGGTAECPVPPAAGVIFGAAGYPARDASGAYGYHAQAQAAAPGTLFAYAAADATATAYNRALLAARDPGRTSAVTAWTRDPAGLLRMPEAVALTGRGPVQFQLQLCVHWWPAEFARWAVGEYARLLPRGSTLALSAFAPGGGAGGGDFAAAMSRAGGEVRLHGEDEIARWVTAARLRLVPPGVTDVRGREKGWAAEEFARRRGAARIVGAVALKP